MKRFIKKVGIFLGLKVEELWDFITGIFCSIGYLFKRIWRWFRCAMLPPLGAIVFVFVFLIGMGELMALILPDSFVYSFLKHNHGSRFFQDIGLGVFICFVLIIVLIILGFIGFVGYNGYHGIRKFCSFIANNWQEAERRIAKNEIPTK